MNIDDLSPELQKKACACHTVEEFHELLKDEGMEIPDEELEGIAGGAWCETYGCSCPGHCEEYVLPKCKK